MKKNLKLLISSAFVVLSFSVSQKIQGMEDSLKYRDQKFSSLGLSHSELGTSNALNQDISNPKYVHSLGIQEQENLTEHNILNDMATPDENHLDVSNHHFPLSLIAGASTYLKEGINFTIEHPIQTVILGLASLAQTVDADASYDQTVENNSSSLPWWVSKQGALIAIVAIPIMGKIAHNVWNVYTAPRDVLVEGHTVWTMGHTTHGHVFTNQSSGRLTKSAWGRFSAQMGPNEEK